jgi:hypothetical protein
MNKLRQERLVDRLMDAYVTWRETCLRVSDAYGSWVSDSGVSATVAFGSYMAALDREEDAAEFYASLLRRTRHLGSGEHDQFDALRGPAWEADRR